jgi:hypothetical protein
MSARRQNDWLINAALFGAGAIALAQVARMATGSRGYRYGIDHYLNDHRAGAMAALTLLESLRQRYGGTALGQFFDQLEIDIWQDRRQLDRLCESLGIPSRTIRQSAAGLSGKMMDLALRARGHEDLQLLEALEALALGIQGKRCLWRALGAAHLDDLLSDPPDIATLERRAVDQWERVENHRLAAARSALARPARRTLRPQRKPWSSAPMSAAERSSKPGSRPSPESPRARTPADVRPATPATT